MRYSVEDGGGQQVSVQFDPGAEVVYLDTDADNDMGCTLAVLSLDAFRQLCRAVGYVWTEIQDAGLAE